MNDCEVKVFNRVHARVAPMCSKNRFVSTIITEPPTSFPAGSLIEIDNRTVQYLQSSTPVENFSLVSFQLDIYATSKAKCREVYAAADEEMIAMNFSRTSGMYINNNDNTQVFRYSARYVAIVDRDGNLYRRS